MVSVTDFCITDSKKRTFTPSSDLTTELVLEHDADFLLKELQPGISKEAVQAFELPADAFDGNLMLVIPEKGFLSSGKAQVKLGL